MNGNAQMSIYTIRSQLNSINKNGFHFQLILHFPSSNFRLKEKEESWFLFENIIFE